MTITDRLLADHKAFRKLLADIDEVARTPPAQRDAARLRRLVPLLRRTVLLHAWVEDVVYFPAAAKSGADLPAALLDHLSQEHKTLDGYMARLEAQVGARPPAMSWPQTFALLSSGLEGHFKREEKDLFPIVDPALGAGALESLSAEADRRKGEAPSLPQSGSTQR
jgi:hemerythrin-like domain-containing protein